MTLYEFKILDLNERMEAVNQYGTFLDNYITKDIKINCYALYRFFVEIVYDGRPKKDQFGSGKVKRKCLYNDLK